ncbi:MAG TPA: hypothetical protein VK641_06800, partial [Terriglobales bacterium]|nr:hypothetical protein [Terriglobales bacterium]
VGGRGWPGNRGAALEAAALFGRVLGVPVLLRAACAAMVLGSSLSLLGSGAGSAAVGEVRLGRQ